MKIYAKNILLEAGWAKNQTLIINDGIISAIQDGQDPDAEVIERPIIPGMVNLHSHSFQKAFAGLTEFRANQEDSFWSWRDAMYRLLQSVTPDDLKIIARYLYCEMLTQGYTSCAEFHYLHHQANGEPYADQAANSHAVIQGALDAGIYLRHCPVFYHYSGFGKLAAEAGQRPFYNTIESFQSLVESLFSHYQNNSEVSIGIAPHSLRAVSKEQLQQLTQWWQTGPIHIHIAEQMREVEDCRAFYQQRPVEFLLDTVAVDERWCLVHATHMTAQECQNFAATGAVAGLCPETEANLGDGVFPASDFLSANGQWGIGSDSHICISPWRELRTLEYSQRFVRQRRNILASESLKHVGRYLWQTAAQQGAQVVNRASGVLAVGRRADLITLDNTCSELCAREDDQWLDSAIFACNDNPVVDVMVAGKWRVNNRQLLQQDNVAADYQKVLARLLRQH